MAGKIIVITGPSGVGKSTMLERVFRSCEAVFSVSATTRKPRPGETHGKDYFFTDRSTFQGMIDAGEMLEWAEVFGEMYGTPAPPVLEATQQGKNVVLDIDVQGGISVHAKVPDATFILIVPPSLDELKKRLRERGTEDPQQVDKRFSKASQELETARQSGVYGYEVMNDDLGRAVQDVIKIIQE